MYPNISSMNQLKEFLAYLLTMEQLMSPATMSPLAIMSLEIELVILTLIPIVGLNTYH